MFQNLGAHALAKLDLTKTQRFLSYLGNPHLDFQVIHVAGTNGKGSVSHMLSAIYQQNGYKTGLFTSPHLKSYRERIKLNGELIDRDFVLEWVRLHFPYLKAKGLSFFEMSMGLACCYFSIQKVDIAMMETGMGGRLDATNVVQPFFTIITNIDYDHQSYLGDTLEEISIEKGGIIKQNTPVLLGNVDASLHSLFAEMAKVKNAPFFLSDPTMIASSINNKDSITFRFTKRVLSSEQLVLPTLAPYQIHNLNTVLHTYQHLKNQSGLELNGHRTRKGLENFISLTGFHGRYQIIHRNPLIIVEAAHNIGGVRFLKSLFENNNVHLHLILGLVDDKKTDSILSLLPQDATYYFCAAKVPRAMEAKKLQQKAKIFGLEGQTWPSPREAVNEIILNADQGDIGLVVGSIYLIAEIL